jgi:hypothetical protein
MWSLSNAFTSAFKKLDPVAIQGYGQAGRISQPTAGLMLPRASPQFLSFCRSAQANLGGAESALGEVQEAETRFVMPASDFRRFMMGEQQDGMRAFQLSVGP